MEINIDLFPLWFRMYLDTFWCLREKPNMVLDKGLIGIHFFVYVRMESWKNFHSWLMKWAHFFKGFWRLLASYIYMPFE